MFRKGLLVLLLFTVQFANAQEKVYQIGLLNKKVYKSPYVRHVKSDLISSYFLVNDTLKVKMDDLEFFEISKGYFQRIYFPNGKSQFYKRITKEKRISLYSLEYMKVEKDGTSSGRRLKYYYIKDSLNLKRVSYRNLHQDLSDCQECQVMMHKVKRRSVAATILTLTGISLFIPPIQNEVGNAIGVGTENDNLPMVAGGVALVGIAYFVAFKNDDILISAISTYNNKKIK